MKSKTGVSPFQQRVISGMYRFMISVDLPLCVKCTTSDVNLAPFEIKENQSRNFQFSNNSNSHLLKLWT